MWTGFRDSRVQGANLNLAQEVAELGGELEKGEFIEKGRPAGDRSRKVERNRQGEACSKERCVLKALAFHHGLKCII